MRRRTTGVLAAALILALGPLGPAQAAELQWWSHWAVEDSKKAVLFEVKRRFEAKHPGNTVEITFYEKKNMWPALRAAFTAGSGFPDVFYYDNDVPEFMAAGWLASDSVPPRLMASLKICSALRKRKAASWPPDMSKEKVEPAPVHCALKVRPTGEFSSWKGR